jgi:hypothetical protein
MLLGSQYRGRRSKALFRSKWPVVWFSFSVGDSWLLVERFVFSVTEWKWCAGTLGLAKIFRVISHRQTTRVQALLGARPESGSCLEKALVPVAAPGSGLDGAKCFSVWTEVTLGCGRLRKQILVCLLTACLLDNQLIGIDHCGAEAGPWNPGISWWLDVPVTKDSLWCPSQFCQ